MGDLGRMLVFVGGLLLVFGLVLILAGKVNLPIGRLPGDIVYRGKNTTFYFPLMTSILLSVILSLVLYVVNRMQVIDSRFRSFADRYPLVLRIICQASDRSSWSAMQARTLAKSLVATSEWLTADS